MHISGWENLSEEFEKEYFQILMKKIEQDRKEGMEIFPPDHQIFNAFQLTPYDQVKVVIVGQDPYHGMGQANGLAFSVSPTEKIPPSLKNIYKEIFSDLGIPPSPNGCLIRWAKQGVLLLNSTLTVKKGEPKSHYEIGWEEFTDSVITLLAKRAKPIVFLLWGKVAEQKCKRILSDSFSSHVTFIAAHPSPFSARYFLGCKHFSKTNDQLKKWGYDSIQW